MKPLTIEIHGTGTHNRGAELMAIAIAQRMQKRYADVRIAVPPEFGDFAARGRYGFLATTDFPGRFLSRITRVALNLAVPGMREALGLVRADEIDVVLDASGFAFSDQWGSGPANDLLLKMSRRGRRNQLLILMPQALGTFMDPNVALHSTKLFKRASLIYARDNQSFEAATKLTESSKLRLYPDFTLAVEPVVPCEIQIPDSFSAIVPNFRLLDKTDKPEQYLKFLIALYDLLERANLNPYFVLHDADEDRKVVAEIMKEREVQVIEHPDPRCLKAILGSASLVVGSRFHALVGALSQSVACIGVGWSHKYPELFRSFDIPELLLSDLEDLKKLESVLSALSDTASREAIQSRIGAAATRLKQDAESMWEEIEGFIDEAMASKRS